MNVWTTDDNSYLFDTDCKVEALTFDRAQGVEDLLHRDRMNDTSQIGSKRDLVQGLHLDFTPDLDLVADLTLTKIQNERRRCCGGVRRLASSIRL